MVVGNWHSGSQQVILIMTSYFSRTFQFSVIEETILKRNMKKIGKGLGNSPLENVLKDSFECMEETLAGRVCSARRCYSCCKMENLLPASQEFWFQVPSHVTGAALKWCQFL